jgi:poly-gamma-glutamate synthesis protein (capsule biosynthesis protein)
MKSFFLRFIFALILILVILRIAEAPGFRFISNKTSENDSKEKITLVFVGDIMLGRNVENLMNLKGKDYPFASTSEIFAGADVVIGNLEGPIMEHSIPTKSGGMSFSFPPYVAELLHNHGINIVSLANNHTFDKGADAYTETVRILNDAGVSSFGHPLTENMSYVGSYEINGIPFSLVGFNSTYPSFDLESALQTVSTMKVINPDSTIIVFMHWGDEYQLQSNAGQKEIADALHNAGAELIIGSHPHVVQETDCQNVKRCTVYSLGNFIFDQYFSKEVEKGMVTYVTLGKGGVENVVFKGISGNHSSPKLSTWEAI